MFLGTVEMVSLDVYFYFRSKTCLFVSPKTKLLQQGSALSSLQLSTKMFFFFFFKKKVSKSEKSDRITSQNLIIDKP